MIFVDTSFWIALRNRRDDFHGQALGLLQRHADDTFVTSNHVRGETWTYLRRRVGHHAAVERSPRVRIASLNGELEE